MPIDMAGQPVCAIRLQRVWQIHARIEPLEDETYLTQSAPGGHSRICMSEHYSTEPPGSHAADGNDTTAIQYAVCGVKCRTKPEFGPQLAKHICVSGMHQYILLSSEAWCCTSCWRCTGSLSVNALQTPAM